MSKDYPQDAALQDDIRATYQWLDDHADAAQPHMSKLQSTKLFLNVTDPKEDVWRWSSAQELLFGIRQETCSFHVRKFLLSFQKLLRASGVERITDAKLTQTGDSVDSDPSAESETLRSAFCLMRDANQLTDVVLINKEDDKLEQVLPAHRAYLAACTTYFLGAFGADFQESGMASAGCPIKVYVGGYSGYAVRLLVGKSSGAEFPGLLGLMHLLRLYKTSCIPVWLPTFRKIISSRSCNCRATGGLNGRG